jgi:hypothetical protein
LSPPLVLEAEDLLRLLFSCNPEIISLKTLTHLLHDEDMSMDRRG